MFEINNLKNASEEQRNNKEIVLNAISKNPFNLEYVSDSLKDDKEVVLLAISQDGRNLKYASERLKKDKEIVLEAAKVSIDSLNYVGDELKSNREIGMALVNINPRSLNYLHWKSRDDKEIVLLAVSKNGLALEYASGNLKNDKQVVLAAVNQNGLALEFANDKLKNDEEVVSAAISKSAYALNYASKRLKDNKRIVLLAVNKEPIALKYAGNNSKDDKEVILAAVSKNGSTLRYASKNLRDDEEVVLAALNSGHFSLENVGKRFQDNEEFVLIALKKQGNINYLGLSDRLKNDKQFLKKILKANPDFISQCIYNPFYSDLLFETAIYKIYGFIPENPEDNEELMYTLVKYNPILFYKASDRLKNDYKFILYAAKKMNYSQIDLTAQSDNEELMFNLVSRLPFKLYFSCSSRLKNDVNFNLRVALSLKESQRERFIDRFINKKLKLNPQFLSALKQNGIDVTKYEMKIKSEHVNEENLHCYYLEICKNYLNMKTKDAKLTKEQFLKMQNITSDTFDSALEFVERNNNDIYSEIKKALFLNSNRYLHSKSNSIKMVVNGIINGVDLGNGEKREFNLIDYCHYLKKFDIPFSYQVFMRELGQKPNEYVDRKLKSFFPKYSSVDLNYNNEYNSKLVMLVDGEELEVSLEQKKYIVSLMAANQLPQDRRIYMTLLRSFVKGRLELEYGFLLPSNSKSNEEEQQIPQTEEIQETGPVR